MRKKGFVGSLDVERLSLKVKFDEFVPDQRLFGTRRLTLNNNKQDPSNIKQCIGYQLFAAAGLPVPRCNFAHVRVTTENETFDLGIYSSVDAIKSAFLERTFGSSSGNLYEGTFGADFRPRWLGAIEFKNNETINDRSDIRALAEVLGTVSDAQLFDALAEHLDIEAFLTHWAMKVSLDIGMGMLATRTITTCIGTRTMTAFTSFHGAPTTSWGRTIR